jgi:hypothetical protein
MALAERLVGQRFNRPGHEIVNHRTWVIASDGDMMEGTSSAAASLAGALRLGKLTCFYDDNHITIECETRIAFCELVANRFEAYGWQVLRVDDGNDLDEIARATEVAVEEEKRPSLVVVCTHRLRKPLGRRRALSGGRGPHPPAAQNPYGGGSNDCRHDPEPTPMAAPDSAGRSPREAGNSCGRLPRFP